MMLRRVVRVKSYVAHEARRSLSVLSGVSEDLLVR